ncbi:MAG: hypothetical protein KJ674_03035 [Nanoarchaeota archaeon]|nr:hypothetical protein [Nanoarchaeota archaeon]
MQEYQDGSERVRILETRYNLMRERLLLINQNMIDEYKNISEDIKIVEGGLKDLKKDMFEVKEALHKIVYELQFFAKKDTLKVLEKYINMWNPLNFVTEEEVLNLIKNSKKRGTKNSRRKQ